MTYQNVKQAWEDLRRRKCDQTGNSNGAHYLLVFALMQVGISCRGLTNSEIEGEAITYLSKGER